MPPEPLYSLLSGMDKRSKDFRERIRAYNSALSFVSFGAKLEVPGSKRYWKTAWHMNIVLYLPYMEEQLRSVQLHYLYLLISFGPISDHQEKTVEVFLCADQYLASRVCR